MRSLDLFILRIDISVVPMRQWYLILSDFKEKETSEGETEQI